MQKYAILILTMFFATGLIAEEVDIMKYECNPDDEYFYDVHLTDGVDSIVDGDTVYLTADLTTTATLGTDYENDLGFGIKLIDNKHNLKLVIDLGKIRFYGVDTPETRTSDPEEKEAGLISKEYVSRALLNAKTIQMKSIKNKKGKFGRYLGILCYDGVNLNRELVEKDLAELNYY